MKVTNSEDKAKKYHLIYPQGAMSTLNRKFSEDLVITKKRLEETRTLVDKEIAGNGISNNYIVII